MVNQITEKKLSATYTPGKDKSDCWLS